MKEKDGVRFGVVSIINHWINALIFLSVLGLGFYLSYLGDGLMLRGPWMEVHKAGGVLLLVLALWRISWRFFQGFPKDLAPMPLWQRLAAKLVHWALIGALVALPVSGILMSLYSERGINVFGLFFIPPQPENILISSAAVVVHKSVAYLVCLALFMHVGAVFKHHFIEKDKTLVRMLTPRFTTYTPFPGSAAVKKKPAAAPRKPGGPRPETSPAVPPKQTAPATPKVTPLAAVKANPPSKKVPTLTQVVPKTAPLAKRTRVEKKV